MHIIYVYTYTHVHTFRILKLFKIQKHLLILKRKSKNKGKVRFVKIYYVPDIVLGAEDRKMKTLSPLLISILCCVVLLLLHMLF